MLKDDDGIDFDLACVVFAHECGHAVRLGEYLDYIFEGADPVAVREGAANYYVEPWGFVRQMHHAIAQGLVFVRRDDLDRSIATSEYLPGLQPYEVVQWLSREHRRRKRAKRKRRGAGL